MPNALTSTKEITILYSDSQRESRYTWSTSPFTHILQWLTIELARTATFWLNAILPSIGVSTMLMTHEILSGYEIDFNTYTKLVFGEVLHTHHGKDNTMVTQSDRCSAIRLERVFPIFHLLTGKVIDRHVWNLCP